MNRRMRQSLYTILIGALSISMAPFMHASGKDAQDESQEKCGDSSSTQDATNGAECHTTQECPICTNALPDKPSVVEAEDALPCGHNNAFHATCLKKWFEKKKNCPLCRSGSYEESRDDDSQASDDEDSLAADYDDEAVNNFFYRIEEGDCQALENVLEDETEAQFLLNCYYRETGYTPLMEAILAGRIPVVNLLLDRGASLSFVNNDGLTALIFAIKEGNREMVSLLLDRGASINPDLEEEILPLEQAIYQGNKSLIKLLLSRGAEVNIYDEYGYNVILNAVLKVGSKSSLALILEKGAVMRADRPSINHVLLAAAQKKYAPVISFLIERGAETETRDSGGNTPLMIAARSGRIAVMRCLLRHGASLDACNNAGETARMLAHRNGRARTLRIIDETLRMPRVSSAGPIEEDMADDTHKRDREDSAEHESSKRAKEDE